MHYTIKEGEEYDVNSYVEMFPATDADKDIAAAYKSAAKADEAQWTAYFKDFYDVTATPGAKDPTNITVELAKKELAPADEETLLKKYEALLANYGKVATFADSTSIKVGAPDQWFEIEFKNSPTKKTYKAKVLKKKAKSFKVKAVATNGEAVNYKLINAPEKIVINKTSGKITLKKGLKKGTYKIRVKAYLPKSYAEKDGSVIYPSETHDITIKVKK